MRGWMEGELLIIERQGGLGGGGGQCSVSRGSGGTGGYVSMWGGEKVRSKEERLRSPES